jgi:hypothetical protein
MSFPIDPRRTLRGLVLAAAAAFAADARAQTLIGVRWDWGALHSISTVDATSTPFGVLAGPHLGDLVRSHDGFLYAIHTNALPYLVRIDPVTGTNTVVGMLGLEAVVHGAIAIREDGIAYGFSAVTPFAQPWMFRIDLATGAAFGLIPLTAGLFDINGAVFRSDGLIAAIDSVPNALVTIDPQTGVRTVVQVLTPAIGGNGGLAVKNGIAYFTTSGPGGFYPGSNELWTIDLYSGAHSLVGSLGSIGDGVGISGIVGDAVEIGAPFCFGDGASIACPCGNASAPEDRAGCRHSGGAGGALRASGVTTLSGDTLVLHGTSLTNSSALYFQGTSVLGGGSGVVFGDGLRCVSGTIVRLGTKMSTGGASQYPTTGDASVSVRGAVPPGVTRHYQVWFRNAAAFCTPSTFNLTNGLSIHWSP